MIERPVIVDVGAVCRQVWLAGICAMVPIFFLAGLFMKMRWFEADLLLMALGVLFAGIALGAFAVQQAVEQIAAEKRAQVPPGGSLYE